MLCCVPGFCVASHWVIEHQTLYDWHWDLHSGQIDGVMICALAGLPRMFASRSFYIDALDDGSDQLVDISSGNSLVLTFSSVP